METFAEYISRIEDPQHRARVEEVLRWVFTTFPELAPRVAWNQPMFTHHGTFIIGFSIAKKHMAIAPEQAGILHFSEEIVKAGYDHTKEIMRISWDKPVNWQLLKDIIAFNIADKAQCTSFWRK